MTPREKATTPHHRPPRTRHVLRHAAQAVAIFAALTAIVHFSVDTERARLTQTRRFDVTQEVLGIAARLEAELNATVFLANGMFALVTVLEHPADADIERALQTLYRFGRHVRNVGLAPNNVISHVYPLKGNEAAVGLSYPDMPSQWPAVRRAINTGATVLAGPIPLVQGGTGLICRTPIFLENGDYWGILSLVLDAESLFASIDLVTEADGVAVALRGTDGRGADGPVFFGDGRLFIQDSIRRSIAIPGGTWEIAARPIAGWSANQGHLMVLEIAGSAAALMLGLGLFAIQQGRLRVIASEERLRAMMDTTHDGVIVIDDLGLIQEFNPAAEILFGYTKQEILGRSINLLMNEDDALHHDRFIKRFQPNNIRRMSASRPIEGKRKDDSVFPAEITVGDTLVADQRLHVGVVRDVTERKAFERQLVELATLDGLTGTLNRRAFLEEAHSRLALARRNKTALSVMMVDADHFKRINDTHGHHVGDAVLVRLAEIIRGGLRDSDRFGRFGGEEFAVILPETGVDQALLVAERLLDTIRRSAVTVDSQVTVHFTVSIGIATLAPDRPEETLDGLIQQADGALYRAKDAGRDRCRHAQAEGGGTPLEAPLAPSPAPGGPT